jgi:hypothetical protein
VAQFAITFGLGIGLQLLSQALQPVQEGPRLDDLSLPKSSYGAQIPIVYGKARFPGNIVWGTRLDERSSVAKNSKGGKGGGGKVRSFAYYGSFAVLLCEGPILGISRIWVNSELKYNVLNTARTRTFNRSRDWRNKYFRIHTGTASQGKDPLIDAEQAVAFGYRHRCYLVFEDLPLEDFGNRIPAIEVEVVTAGTISNGRITPSTVPLSTVVTGLCQRAGLSAADIDVTELEDTQVVGFFVASPTTVTNALQQLQQTYFFDVVDSGGVVKFQLQSQTKFIDVALSHPAAHEYGQSTPDFYQERREDDTQLPKEIALTYIDPKRNFGQNVQRSTRTVSLNQNNVALNLPIILSEAQARAAADRLLHLSWLRRNTVQFRLSYRYLFLEPGDVVGLGMHGTTVDLQLSRVNLGANLLLDLESRTYQGAGAAFDAPSNPPDTDEPGDGDIVVLGDTVLQVFDIPLIQDGDSDIGLYVAAYGDPAPWRGASLHVSRDGGSSYSLVSAIPTATVMGSCSTVIGNYTGVFDTIDAASTLRVTLAYGQLESITEARMRAGENVVLVGNEIVRFQTATLVSAGVYDLTNFLRGRRGTDWAIANHGANERFVLLTGTGTYTTRVQREVADLGQTLYFKATATDQTLDEVTAVSLAFAGISQECYSPIGLAATRDNAGNIWIAWTRRDRKAGDRTDYANFPMSEVAEQYEIEFRNAADTATLRTLSSATPGVTYLVADQVTDFGVAQTSVRVRVYQLSALVGRGYPAAANLTTTLVPATPTITDFSPRSGSISDTIRVYGTGFAGATELGINETDCTSVVVVSDAEITGVIAAGTTTGPVSVTTPGGTVSSAIAFVIGSAYTDEQAQDAAASLFINGNHLGIAFNYDDVGNKIDATVTSGGGADLTRINLLLLSIL